MNSFIARKLDIRAAFSTHPKEYMDVVKRVLPIVSKKFDIARLREIDDSSYQGTLVYIVGETGCQPRTYWTTTVDYGSCSGCDTLAGIRGYEDAGCPTTEEQVNDYLALALHLVENLKEV